MSPGYGKAEDACHREGRYANYFEIGHNAFEFLFDFGQFYPEDNEARFHTRIVMGPTYAKAFLEVLQGAVYRYTEAFGAIPERETEENPNAR